MIARPAFLPSSRAPLLRRGRPLSCASAFHVAPVVRPRRSVRRRPVPCVRAAASIDAASDVTSSSGPAAQLASAVKRVADLWWTFQTWRATRWLTLNVEGVDYLGETIAEPCVIVACNHASSVDWPVAVAALREAGCDNVYLLGDKGWERNPFTRDLNVIPVSSSKGFSLADLGTIEARVGHHAENMEPVTFLMFPEGTPSATGALVRFKASPAYLASKLGCQVLPAFIQGSHQVLPRGALVPTRHPVTLTFASPLPAPDDMASEADTKALDPERRLSAPRRRSLQKYDEEVRASLTALRRQRRANRRPALSASQRKAARQAEVAQQEEEGRWVRAYSTLVAVLRPVEWVRALLGRAVEVLLGLVAWAVARLRGQEGGALLAKAEDGEEGEGGEAAGDAA